jgi:palmitoyltransferase ZDHHC9/14/18
VSDQVVQTFQVLSDNLLAMTDNSNASTPTRLQHAPSIHSSRMTDVASEDGDEYHPEGVAGSIAKAKSNERSLTESNQPQSPPQSLYSRRGSNRRGFGGPGLSMANSNRIQNLQNRNSMTHAPSLTSQAFFRPMSSQRLQAQRGTRPSTAGREEISRPSTSTIDRPSLESAQTITPKPKETMIPTSPSSRGTDFTDHNAGDRALYNASPTGHNTIQSTTESTRPLQASTNGRQEHQETRLSASFRTNFLRSSRQSPAPNQIQFDENQRMSNDTGSPHLREKSPIKSKSEGKNYEYFSGNTAFFWGGRFQNTRDRPINIGTALLIILPTVLFFVYE